MIAYTTHINATATEWVTFVHGAGGSSNIWYKQVKAFKAHFNVLLLDLRGHGSSKENLKNNYTFPSIANDIIEVLNFLKLEKSHFVGISLGTIIIRQLAEDYGGRVQSMILGGAIMKMNFRSQVLMKLGNATKYILPYLILYRFFAFVIMPNKNHKESRSLFIREAKKLYQKEFIRWFKLTADINPLLKLFRQIELPIPTLYVMGDEDYMFLPAVQTVVSKHLRTAKLSIIANCGHVVNVQQWDRFNNIVLSYLRSLPV
jgi:pimeloyl-ACP methyl ester carboxylesterase